MSRRARVVTETGALRARWSLAVLLLTAVLIAGAGVVYTSWTQREADRRWCELLASLEQPQAPPSTRRGHQIQEQISELRQDLGCGGDG